MQIHIYVSCLTKFGSLGKGAKNQAGAELGQAQVKLDAIIKVIVEVGVEVEVVKLSSTIILGGWLGGWSDNLNLTKLKSSGS